MDEPELIVRAGDAGDYEAVAALQREIQAAHAEASPRYFVPPSAETLTRETFRRWLDDGNRQLLVATLAGRVVGHAWLVLHERAANNIRPAMIAVEIDQLCVTAAARGRGHAGRLLAAAESWARMRGASALELSVWQFNRDAVALYERRGFVPLWQRMGRPL